MSDRSVVHHDFDEWFVGFFDGDGCVSMEICERTVNRLGYEIRPMIQISHTQVAGCMDSDGSVWVHMQKRDHGRVGYTTLPCVSLAQLDSDRLIHALEAYCDRLGITCQTAHHEPANLDGIKYSWRVTGIDNLNRLLGPMQEEFIVKREQVNILLDDIIPRLKQGVHHDKAGFLEVMYHVDRLTAQNSSTNRKYTLSYFEDLWGMEHQP